MNEPIPPFYDSTYFDGPLAAWHRLSRPTFAAFLQAATTGIRPRNILDLGCGTGAYGQILHHMGDHLVGCEGSPEAVRRARETGWYEQVLCMDLEEATATQLAGPYDLVFCTEVIEHLTDEHRFCQLMVETLAPGGRLVLTTSTYHFYVFYYFLCAVPRQPGAYKDFLRGCWDDAAADQFIRTLWTLTGGHYHGFRASRLLSCLLESGFVIERWTYANVQPVIPLTPLDEPRFQKRMWRIFAPLVRKVGHLVNEGCRRTNCYGANILVSACRGRQ